MSNHRKLFDNLIKPFIHRSADRAAKKEDDLETIAAQEQKLFPYRTLVVATRDFHLQNKLGAGGFGPVYKGKLEDGREIAVKKLSQSSNQGKKEFLNEASLLARLQHKNVVNLLGYCAEGSEKLLVYEYISNESLDKILFHSGKRAELDWKKRFDIITGVARGLVYLHQDAPSRIIHRDIKASNILLDDKWMPKIADFGMARLFAEDQTHVNTRVAGTNGYMAPEYVMHGQLSEKADVFSFGVLVLETISGKKNSTFNADPDAQSLLEWAWKLYKKGRALEMMDPSLGASAVTKQVAMCIHIGLLCVQADPTLRPDMPRVVFIMSRQPSNLEEPTKPPYPGSRYRRSSIRGSSSRASAATSSGHSYTRSCTDSDTTTNTNTTTTTNTNSATTSTNDPPTQRR